MNKVQIGHLQMWDATLNYLDKHATIWNAVPILNKYKNELAPIVDAVHKKADDQEAAKVFISKSLQEVKLEVATKMDILDDTLEAYADDIENAELLSKAQNSKSDYYKLTNEDFEIKVRNMILLLEQYVADMADYGISQDQIDEVKQQFSIYEERKGVPRTYQVASKVATQGLEELFNKGNELLRKLDKVMNRYKNIDPTFHNGYKASRMIIG